MTSIRSTIRQLPASQSEEVSFSFSREADNERRHNDEFPEGFRSSSLSSHFLVPELRVIHNFTPGEFPRFLRVWNFLFSRNAPVLTSLADPSEQHP
jgi:hypothetical protein